MSITPQGGLTFTIATGGVPVQVIPPGVSGGYIVNPFSAADQGFSGSTAPENLVVDPVNPPSLVGNNTSTTIGPGQSYTALTNSTLGLWVNAATGGHKITVVYWL